ncbi:hypothetical protein GGI26_001026 [Coemansia sp. RSA 1358]|nr:hypothetical protein EDC05_004000 [Coemansia umbellata]KAJ2624914.1 hypothetical protein GGI26_001026 [Coemansia sp. RSA 1358]
MSQKNSIDAESKKKARDDALEFLETLKISDDPNAQNNEAAHNNEDAAAHQDNSASSGKDEDPKSMLKFIDDLTESAKRTNSLPDNGSGETKNGDSANSGVTSNNSSSWSWGGLWGQATALVEQNQQLKSGIGKLKESLDHVRNTEASRSIESRVKTFVNQENISKFSGDLKRSLDTVIDTLAPPIQEHEVFSIHLVDNVGDENIESVVYRTMDSVFDFHGTGEINVKSAAVEMKEAPEMKTTRGDTFTLPKGFDGGYGAAVSAIQFIQNARKSNAKETKSSSAVDTTDPKDGEKLQDTARSTSPLFYRAQKTELFVAVQPFSVIPIEDQGFMSLCVVLRDPSRNITLRTFSQMLPLSCWAKPHDQIVAVDIDSSLGSAVNMKSDSIIQRMQEMNEECLYEAVMLAVKSLSNEYLTSRPSSVERNGAAAVAVTATPSSTAAGNNDVISRPLPQAD